MGPPIRGGRPVRSAIPFGIASLVLLWLICLRTVKNLANGPAEFIKHRSLREITSPTSLGLYSRDTELLPPLDLLDAAAGIQMSSDPAWDRSCSPSPWLLTQGEDIPYKGLHNNISSLSSMQARNIDGFRAVSVLFFNYHQSVMLQNAVYSMVKWSGVCNYIVAVWDEPSLEVCRALNLPCFNATSFTPGDSTIGAEQEAKLHTEDYVKITWMKPIIVSELLDLGFVVHASDVDLAYAPADLTRSYLEFILSTNTTAAFQRESKYPFIVNTGNYMVLPTEQGKRLMKKWLNRADEAIANGHHEQTALGAIYHGKEPSFFVCSSPSDCLQTTRKAEKFSPPIPVIRRTSNAWYTVFGLTCVTKQPERLSPIHPCSFPFLYFHSVCVVGSSAKIMALKGVGFWFLDDGSDSKGCPADAANPNVVRCVPLVDRAPEVESAFLTCDTSRVVFNYYQRMLKGAAAVDPKKNPTTQARTVIRLQQR